MTTTNNSWKKSLTKLLLSIGFKDTSTFEEVPYDLQIQNFIESLLLQKDKEKEEVVREYKQFILNVLDGIDEADKQIGNIGGGTKAIRLAINNRAV